MKLKDDFFRVTDIRPVFRGTVYTVALNADHVIYRAHFPGNPVTPGACIIQMVKELLSTYTAESELHLARLYSVKFLKVISPLEYPEVQVHIQPGGNGQGAYRVFATLYSGDTRFTKLNIQLV